MTLPLTWRVSSKTFGKWYGVVLSEENKKQFYIPRGFAHGFSVLSETAIFNYKCDNFYNKESDCGIIFNDSLLNIDWRVDEMVISEKDRNLKRLSELSPEELFILKKSSHLTMAGESSMSQ